MGLQIPPVKLPAVRIAVRLVTVERRTLGPLAEPFVDCMRGVVRPVAKRNRANVAYGWMTPH